jgi:hypothetical protein
VHTSSGCPRIDRHGTRLVGAMIKRGHAPCELRLPSWDSPRHSQTMDCGDPPATATLQTKLDMAIRVRFRGDMRLS